MPIGFAQWAAGSRRLGIFPHYNYRIDRQDWWRRACSWRPFHPAASASGAARWRSAPTASSHEWQPGEVGSGGFGGMHIARESDTCPPPPFLRCWWRESGSSVTSRSGDVCRPAFTTSCAAATLPGAPVRTTVGSVHKTCLPRHLLAIRHAADTDTYIDTAARAPTVLYNGCK